MGKPDVMFCSLSVWVLIEQLTDQFSDVSVFNESLTPTAEQYFHLSLTQSNQATMYISTNLTGYTQRQTVPLLHAK